MNYKVIASGSKGNCVVINDVLIDCGLGFKIIKEELYSIKYLLLTHIHSDHIKPSTLRQIKKLFPRITVIGNYEVHQTHGVDIISNEGFEVITPDYTFLPFHCTHDVITQGFTWEYGDTSIIYATDSSDLDSAPVGKYDFLFLESNHDEKKLDMIIDQNTGGYSPYLNGKRHLSTQAAKGFYYSNRRNKDSKFIELHKSDRFY